MDNALMETLKSAGPLVLVMLLVNGVGLALKSIKRFDNDWIPAVLIPLGGIATMGLFPNGDMPFEAPYPWAYKLILGIVIGAASVGAHQLVSKISERNKPLEEQIAALQSEIATLREKKAEVDATPKP